MAPRSAARDHFYLSPTPDIPSRSRDSRWPAAPGDAVGMVPQDNLVGKAQVMMWSTDGGASWLKPWTWFTAARWGRIGDVL